MTNSNSKPLFPHTQPPHWAIVSKRVALDDDMLASQPLPVYDRARDDRVQDLLDELYAPDEVPNIMIVIIALNSSLYT